MMQEHTRKQGSNTVFAHKVVEIFLLFSPLSKEKEKRKKRASFHVSLGSVSEMTRVDWWVHLAMLKIEQRTFEHLQVVDVPLSSLNRSELPGVPRSKSTGGMYVQKAIEMCATRENLTEDGMPKAKVTFFMEAVNTAREYVQWFDNKSTELFCCDHCHKFPLSSGTWYVCSGVSKEYDS